MTSAVTYRNKLENSPPSASQNNNAVNATPNTNQRQTTTIS